jgi:tRNA (mo5U34)-methyltransferase
MQPAKPPRKSCDVGELVGRAREFRVALSAIKSRVEPRDFEWYPYDSLTNLDHFDKLLTGRNRNLLDLIGDGPLVDIGCGDGDLAYFFESLGCRVQLMDHPATNHNGMKGARALREALGSDSEIHSLDLDRQFALPADRYRLVLFLNLLYHLKNPFYVMELLSRQCDYCLLSTRIANTLPGRQLDLRDAPIAYLLDSDELNNDNSNYWIFSEAGLRRLLKRTNWEIRDFCAVGASGQSDPNSLDRDQRAWCLARSHYALAHADLLSGWHSAAPDGWRWTEQRFSARLETSPARTAQVELKLYVPPELIARFGSVTLFAAADRRELPSWTLREAGAFSYTANFDPAAASAGWAQFDFWLDHALPPSDQDARERGSVVSSLELLA